MQQASEHTPEFQGVDTRSWTSFFRLAERWESVHSLNRSDMLYELLQGYLRGELWPTILPNVYGGTALTAAPVRPYWMKSARRWPIETFTRLDFLRAAKLFAGLQMHFQDDPFAAGHRGLIGISLDKYADLFIESYIKKLTPSPNALVRWCSDHGWPVPPGLSYSETDVASDDQEEHAGSQKHRADAPNESMKEIETTGKAQPGDARPDQQRKKTAARRNRGGRKPGSGAYTAQDRPLWEKMKIALDQGDATSPWDAAKDFVDDAPGQGTFDSKRRRLAAGYSDWITTQ